MVSEAAAIGDYAAVVKIASWARTLSELALRDEGSASGSVAASAAARKRRTPRATAATSTGARIGRRAVRSDYPRFLRQHDQLVRIAYSKREKKEYRHKAPYSVLQALISAMSSVGTDGKIFSTDVFLPLRDPSDNSDVPNYQAYVGIALMKQTGLIDQHGRQGYSIPRFDEFQNAVKAVWQSLPEQR